MSVLDFEGRGRPVVVVEAEDEGEARRVERVAVKAEEEVLGVGLADRGRGRP